MPLSHSQRVVLHALAAVETGRLDSIDPDTLFRLAYRHLPHLYHDRAALAATCALAGTEARILVMAARAARGESLWHPADPPAEGLPDATQLLDMIDALGRCRPVSYRSGSRPRGAGSYRNARRAGAD